ncbi:MAG: UDP-N-acetylmuramoyl-tripeptide--D-alanyl-D-alanine ligase [Candidatus Paceibacterota bacterium]
MLRNPLYHIYLLQLENYHLRRFVTAAARDCFSPPEKTRHPITWTAKLIGVTTLAVLFALLLSLGAGLSAGPLFSDPSVVGWGVAVTVFLFMYIGFFLPLAVGSAVTLPLDRVIRLIIRAQARRKVSRLDNLTIIGITGSYGKTTMKRTLKTLLSAGKNVVATDESHNTPIAVARSLLNDVTDQTDIFIVEMGAYGPGDIKALCEITPPDISVLNGINEAHFERFGSLENTINTKFEIATSVPDAAVILNADDETVMKNYKRFVGDREPLFYSAKNHEACDFEVYDKRFHEDGTGISFRVKRDDQALGYAKVNHFADYIIGNVIAGLCVGQVLGISEEKVLKAAHQITPTSHRLQPIQRTSSNVLVIDDSYNGNPAGAHAAIGVLEKFISRRTIYVTPGLVEMGERAPKLHREIGKHLAAVVDVVVLVETSVTDYIEEGLRQGGFGGELVTFASPQEMHAGISELLKPRDVLLFQNDWPENYR